MTLLCASNVLPPLLPSYTAVDPPSTGRGVRLSFTSSPTSGTSSPNAELRAACGAVSTLTTYIGGASPCRPVLALRPAYAAIQSARTMGAQFFCTEHLVDVAARTPQPRARAAAPRPAAHRPCCHLPPPRFSRSQGRKAAETSQEKRRERRVRMRRVVAIREGAFDG